jgi:hypothetical protein
MIPAGARARDLGSLECTGKTGTFPKSVGMPRGPRDGSIHNSYVVLISRSYRAFSLSSAGSPTSRVKRR